LILTEQNYHSPEASMQFMGASQFKAFLSCPQAALAACRGEYQQEKTTSLLVGSYVDAHFSGTLDLFKAQNPDIFKRDGGLKAEYVQAEEIIARMERDAAFMAHLTGQAQVIMTGEIAGVKFKVKPDFLHPNKIVDLKVMKDFAPVWVDGEGKLPFIEAWGYDIQAAIYQEIVRQNTGKQMPFFIAAATKEKTPDIGLFEIAQSRLDEMFAEVEHYAPEYSEMKLGLREAPRCGHCDWCKQTKVLTGPVDYREALA
jgi:hypothetical protein